MNKHVRSSLDRLSSLCYRNHTCQLCGGDEYGLDDDGEEGGMYHKPGCPWLIVEAECQQGAHPPASWRPFFPRSLVLGSAGKLKNGSVLVCTTWRPAHSIAWFTESAKCGKVVLP